MQKNDREDMIGNSFRKDNAFSKLSNYTYILRCSDGTYYCGWTNNLPKRLKAHNLGQGAKYTRVRLPVELVYFEEFDNKILAMKREAQIKKMKRSQKREINK